MPTSLAAILAHTVGAIFGQMLGRFALPALHGRRVGALAHHVAGSTTATASHGGSVRAVLAPMALLAAATATTAHLTRLGAISLVVTVDSCQSWPQFKEIVVLTRSRHS